MDKFEKVLYSNDSLNEHYEREKIFIHLDKPYYKLKDTIWLKGYIVSAAEHLLQDSSKIAYVEIINAKDELIRRVSSPCFMGLFASNITVSETIFRQGRYRLRAYTNRLRNFGDSVFFETNFNIIDPGSQEWKTTVKQLSLSGNHFRILASISGQGTQRLANQPLTLRLRSGNKAVFRFNTITDHFGNILIDTLLKDLQTKDLQLELAVSNTVQLQIPVPVSDKPLIDLQFMPEGGMLIIGKEQKLGFKAVDAFGKSIDVKGVIRNNKDETVLAFNSTHRGMGIIVLKPKPGETYTAVLDNGLHFQLPEANVSGIAMQVTDKQSRDSIRLKLDASTDLIGRTIYFSAATRGITALRGKFVVKSDAYVINLDRKTFHSGITVFTLYDEHFQPINERAIFIWQNDHLRLTMSTHKPTYQHKDSVSVSLNVQDPLNNNVFGNFSMAVIDTTQVKMPVGKENILTYLFLCSDLAGRVEEPAYYFENPDPTAVDALMLTQGWVSYRRNKFDGVFPYEKGYAINGHVSNIFNKGLGNVKVLLFGKAGRGNTFIMDTVTDTKGVFRFENFNYYDTDSVSMMLKATNRRGKDFNVGIELQEPSYPSIQSRNVLQQLGDVLIDTVAHAYVSTQQQIKSDLKKDGMFLEEVFVVAKRKIVGSKNLNADGGADQVIDEEALNKTPKESLLDVIGKQVKGFRLGSPPRSNSLMYMINSNIVRVVVDGINLHFFYQPFSGQRDEYAQFLRTYLEYFAAEDVKAIEIMNNPSYNSTYRSEYLTTAEQMNSGPVTTDYSFIEITTKSGQGPMHKKSPGVYLLKPVFPFVSKQFYSPRYTSPDQPTVFPDLRNTIYWNPDIMTDSNGKAQISFYTSESKTKSYLIVIQGIDLNGNVGVLYQSLQIDASKK